MFERDCFYGGPIGAAAARESTHARARRSDGRTDGQARARARRAGGTNRGANDFWPITRLLVRPAQVRQADLLRRETPPIGGDSLGMLDYQPPSARNQGGALGRRAGRRELSADRELSIASCSCLMADEMTLDDGPNQSDCRQAPAAGYCEWANREPSERQVDLYLAFNRNLIRSPSRRTMPTSVTSVAVFTILIIFTCAPRPSPAVRGDSRK